MRAHFRRTPAAALATVVVLAMLTGCTPTVPGAPTAGDGTLRSPVDPGFVQGSGGGAIDQLAAATVTDVRAYWRQAFPAEFGKPWRDLGGGYHSVDTALGTTPPPCAASAREMEGNAYYCSGMDALAWDRAALLPVLRDRYGEAAVVLVLAHEMGHAVQSRTGLDPRSLQRHPDGYPSALVEGMADCYAGSSLRWIVDGNAAHLRIEPGELDAALRALITFRDPVGTSPRADSAHGSAFDRASALLDGYETGPRTCSDMPSGERRWTEREFTDRDGTDGTDQPAGDLLRHTARSLDARFGSWVAARGGQWRSPELRTGDSRGCAPPGRGPGATPQGPVSLCPGPAVAADTGRGLARWQHDAGDFAGPTLLASRYALAARAATGESARGPAALRGTMCLTGAYISTARGGPAGISRSDLDEAVQLVLASDLPSRDAAGTGLPRAFDRFESFRQGVLGGFDDCDRE